MNSDCLTHEEVLLYCMETDLTSQAQMDNWYEHVHSCEQCLFQVDAYNREEIPLPSVNEAAEILDRAHRLGAIAPVQERAAATLAATKQDVAKSRPTLIVTLEGAQIFSLHESPGQFLLSKTELLDCSFVFTAEGGEVIESQTDAFGRFALSKLDQERLESWISSGIQLRIGVK